MRRFQNLCGFGVEHWDWRVEFDDTLSYINMYRGVDMRTQITENGGGAAVCEVSLIQRCQSKGHCEYVNSASTLIGTTTFSGTVKHTGTS